MKIMQTVETPNGVALQPSERPKPIYGPGELLIRVCPAGVIDLVVDTVGGDTLANSWSVLRSGGRVVTTVSGIPNDAPQRMKDAFFLVQPDGQRLAEIADLLDAGKLRTFVKDVVPLQDAEQAYGHFLPSELGYGKTVVSIAES